jgi:hypothetical protein
VLPRRTRACPELFAGTSAAPRTMKFARIVFLVAAIWGVLVLTPLYFMFDLIGRQDPPPITHPAFFYGLVGVALVWQIAFFVISRDPVRLRPLMIPAMLE